MSSSSTAALRGLCPAPFFNATNFPDKGGFIDGRLCQSFAGAVCCLPCPMTDWVYPDSFDNVAQAANWVNVVGMIACIFLLVSWAVLPVEKTHRHYLSICLTCAVALMNLGFIIPLAAKPDQCFDQITPNGMKSSSVCAASGTFLLLGGWAGIMWVFLRSLSLHLQICWQMVVGRNYMWFSQATGWGVPIIGIVVALLFSGVSFRFGPTCHINHQNSLADFWIPLLVFAGLTVIIQFATFGYCIKVYLASLADNSASTEGSGLPSYSNSIRTMTPRQAYRRVRRVIQLQWRGIAIVLIIIADVIFFSVIFVFQDNTIQTVKENPAIAQPWVFCLAAAGGDKSKCLDKASALAVNVPTVGAVLILLAINGIWLAVLLGRWSMVTGWIDLFRSFGGKKQEFVSVDARADLKKDARSYEMLSRDSGKAESILTPISAAKSPSSPRAGRQTPDYFGQTARYQPHNRSFSSPRPPQQGPGSWEQPEPMPQTYNIAGWDSRQTYGRSEPQGRQQGYEDMNPLGMNRI